MSTFRILQFLHQTTLTQVVAAVNRLNNLTDTIQATSGRARSKVKQWGWKPWIVFFTTVVGVSTIAGMCLAIAILPSSVQSEQLAAWDADREFRAWCQSESDAARTVTAACKMVLQSTLEPPPGSTFSHRLLKSLRRRWTTFNPVSQKHAYSTQIIGFDLCVVTLVVTSGSVAVLALLRSQKMERTHNEDVEYQNAGHSRVESIGVSASLDISEGGIAVGREPIEDHFSKALTQEVREQSRSSTLTAQTLPISPNSATPRESSFMPPQRHAESAISMLPTDRVLFGAITQKVRERSRSRTRVRRSRSRSPAPSLQVASSPPASTSPSRSQKLRPYSDITQDAEQTSITTPAPPQHQRPNSDSFYYGRHANQWLFGAFSVRESAHNAFDALQKKRA